MKKKFFGHNFGAVFRFEVLRMLKKKTFWAAMLSFPVMFAVIFGISFWSASAGKSASNELASEKFSMVYTDASGVISEDLATQLGAKNAAGEDDKAKQIAKVESGELDAYFYYPQDLSKDKVKIYAKNAGIFENSKYQAVAQSLLQSSVLAQTAPGIAAVLAGQIGFEVKTYEHGKEFNPLMEMIAPGFLLVLFYMIMMTFGAQMIIATTEEKENRVSEMILTTIRARTLIIGKIFAQLALVLIQVLVLVALAVTAYLLLKSNLNLDLPFDMSQIVFDPVQIFTAVLIFLPSLLLFTGLLVAIGAAVPTAREANQFSTVPILALIAPLWAINIFIVAPASTVSVFLTLFPFTAPVPMMLRNALGNLTVWETIVGVAILMVTSVITFIIAARLFQTGAVEYSKKMSLKGLFARKTA